MKFKKKPVMIEAVQWTGFGMLDPIILLIKKYQPTAIPSKKNPFVCKECGGLHKDHGWVKTLEGGHRVCPNDWIITGVKGEKYPCKPDIFEMTYEAVDEPDFDMPDMHSGMFEEEDELDS